MDKIIDKIILGIFVSIAMIGMASIDSAPLISFLMIGAGMTVTYVLMHRKERKNGNKVRRKV